MKKQTQYFEEHAEVEMEKGGTFVISLDFELLWGVFDKVDYTQKKAYFRNTRNLIPQLLQLFSDYEIHVTWATVGMLFNENWKGWTANIPERIPDYNRRELSAYHFGHSISSPTTEELCMARDLVAQISITPHQEIATHTYSHYYCLEQGQTVETFQKDLEQCIVLAREMDISLKSLVFPRNQYNEQYLQVCWEMGIENVRSNPDVWYWSNTMRDAIQDKIFRTGDAYLGLNDKSYTYEDLKWEEGRPLAQKASRLLRPHSGNSILDTLKLNRIKSEMLHAAKQQEVYHLWWHPHNFANHPEENLRELREILEHYQTCKKTYGFRSRNMVEVNQLVRAV